MAPWSVQLCTMLRGRPNGSARRVPARGRCVAARHTAAAGRVRQGVGRDQAAPGPAARAAALATATERVRLLASSPRTPADCQGVLVVCSLVCHATCAAGSAEARRSTDGTLPQGAQKSAAAGHRRGGAHGRPGGAAGARGARRRAAPPASGPGPASARATAAAARARARARPIAPPPGAQAIDLQGHLALGGQRQPPPAAAAAALPAADARGALRAGTAPAGGTLRAAVPPAAARRRTGWPRRTGAGLTAPGAGVAARARAPRSTARPPGGAAAAPADGAPRPRRAPRGASGGAARARAAGAATALSQGVSRAPAWTLPPRSPAGRR
jgi:hypothetical protein